MKALPALEMSPQTEMHQQMQELLEASLRGLQKILNAQEGSLCWMNISTQELIVTIAVGPRAASYLGHRQPIGQGAAGQVALTDNRCWSRMWQRTGYWPAEIRIEPARSCACRSKP